MNVNFPRQRRSAPLGLIAYALLLVFSLPPALAQTAQPQPEQRGGVDWIFVIDTSASMVGAGGTKDIFADVKKSLTTFITGVRNGDSVTLYTYDRDTLLRPTVRISDRTDSRDLLNTVDDLQATGDRTHTGKAIRDALERARELGERADAANRRVGIVLMTDGLEDVRGIPNPVSIPSNVSLVPKNRPYVFVVSLGEQLHEQQLEDFINNPALEGRGEMVRDPGAENVQKLGERIRPLVEATATPTPTLTPAPTPVPIELSASPPSLDFGVVEPGEETGRETVRVSSGVGTRVRLAVEGGEGMISLVEPSEPSLIEVGADSEASVKVRLAVSDAARDGVHSARLTLTPEGGDPGAALRPATVEARVLVERVASWRKLIKWLAIALIALILIIIAYSLLKGEMPLTLWKKWRERNHLEGALEVIRPASAQVEDGNIDLTYGGRARVSLSELIPGGATADSDADLSSFYKNGVKLIRLERTKGVVRVNNTETLFIELYDGDIIELGDAKLRFNWPMHDRPIEADETIY